MSGALPELESAGYRFRLDGSQLKVRGPRLDDPSTVEQLRERKPEILDELLLRQFIDLVRVIAACKHGRLLHRELIRAELDHDDIADLRRSSGHARRDWAELLAHRLTRPGPGWEDAA